MAIIAFDFDNTLTKTDTTKYLIISLLINAPQRLFLMLFQIILHWGKIQEMKIGIIGCLIKNKSEPAVGRSLRFYFRMVNKHIRSSLFNRLLDHLTKGDRLILATASPLFAQTGFFKDINIQLIATEFNMVNGRFTGKLKSPICFGSNKAIMVRNYLEMNKIEYLDVAYSDHSSDFPLLNLSKKPILVCPDSRTRQKAQTLQNYGLLSIIS
jgi:phosphatidylglycerophosphatase C